MFNYLIGYPREINVDSIVLDVNGIGYDVLIARPNEFERDEMTKVYTYMQVRDDGISLYGFKTKEEKALFLRLISVSGIGPKTAIGMFYNSSAQSIVQAVETSNTSYLKKLPGIGPKAAQQIILDLKGKLVFDNLQGLNGAQGKTNLNLEDAREGLKSLGFKNAEIDRVFSQISKEPHTSEEYLKLALQLLRK